MSDVVLDGYLEKMRGVIGREPASGEVYELCWGESRERTIHMFGVRRPLRVTFESDGVTTLETILNPWTGVARAEADIVYEEGL